MGLTIILSIIICLFIVFDYDELHKAKTTNISKKIFTILGDLTISVGISIVLTIVATVVVHGALSEKESNFTLVSRQIEELEELMPNTYIITGIDYNPKGADYAKATVKVNGETKTVQLGSAKITLNSSEHMMETRHYDFANPILNWLLFEPQQKECDIYTPQSSLGGAFTVK